MFGRSIDMMRLIAAAFATLAVAFGIGWFFLTLAVESSLIPLDPVFEHRLYLPMLGFVAALLGLAQTAPRQRLVAGTLLMIVAWYGVLTWQRNELWNDPLAFSADNVPYRPKHHLTLATEGLEEGDFAMAAGYPGITFRNNLFDDINHSAYGTNAKALLVGGGAATLVFDRNTIIHTNSSVLYAYGAAASIEEGYREALAAFGDGRLQKKVEEVIFLSESIA